MDIFDSCVEFWKQITKESSHIFQPKIIVENEFIGKDNNCLSAVPKSIILLDGNLNQLHFFKSKNSILIHQVVLMTPQPIHTYNQFELSTTRQFIALIGKDTVGIVDITNINTNKTCKKVKEVFNTQDDILVAHWYPHMHDILVILTKQSINIFQCRPDMRVVHCFQYCYYNDGNSKLKSFGIKDEFVNFDFGSSEISSDDNKLFILTDSGDILLLPELRILRDQKDIVPKKLSFSPPSPDNYQDDFTSLVVLRGSLDILVLVNCHGTVQHAIVINEKVCVYETINVLSVSKDHESEPLLVADRHAYPPRYLLLHSYGIHSCVLPWIVRLRLAVQETKNADLSMVLNEAGHAVIDHAIDTVLPSRHIHVRSEIHGLTIVRQPMSTPELIVFINNGVKRIVRTKLRQESSLMLTEDDTSGTTGQTSTGHAWPSNPESRDILLKAVMTELGRGSRVPYVAANARDYDDEGEAKLALVLKISEKITSDIGTRLENVGQIMAQRMEQMKSIVELQRDQITEIVSSTEQLQKNALRLSESFHQMSSRQRCLLNRLCRCSDRLAAMNDTIPRADRESAKTITQVSLKIASMEAMLRSCKCLYEKNEEYIDRMALVANNRRIRLNDSVVEEDRVEEVISDEDLDRTQEYLGKEDEEIRGLVNDVRGLLS